MHVAGPNKRASKIADLVEADIMRRGWPVGEVIGTYANLIDQYGVSRAVVREAIGLLEHKTIVEMSHGPGGGIRVRAPIAEAVVGSISAYLDYTGVTDGELVELRQRLMCLATRLATERIDEAGAERLRGIVDRAKTLEAENPSWLLNLLEILPVITELSGNPALELFWASLIQRVTAGLVGGFEASLVRRNEMILKLSDFVDAVVAGDSSLAEAKVLEFQSVAYDAAAAPAERMVLKESEKRKDVEEALRALGVVMPGLARDRRNKLPARVVRQLISEIRGSELEPGDVLGMERDLMERIGVSRSVFREAVRIIEFYGLAEMRRGVNGGLTVRRPGSAKVEETVIGYLEYMGIGLLHLHEVRIAIELMNVEWTIERAGSNLDVLDDIVRQERIDRVPKRPIALHEMISELSNNRASQLLSNVLSKRLDRFAERPERHPGSRTSEELAELAAQGHDEHLRIAESVIAGDVGLARRRMLRHLQ